MEENTTDSIIAVLERWAKAKEPIDPLRYVEAASKLNIFLGDEADKLFEMEQGVARMRVKLLEEGFNATQARMNVEASDEYKEARKQKAKIERVVETIRLAKLRGRMAGEEMRLQ